MTRTAWRIAAVISRIAVSKPYSAVVLPVEHQLGTHFAEQGAIANMRRQARAGRLAEDQEIFTPEFEGHDGLAPRRPARADARRPGGFAATARALAASSWIKGSTKRRSLSG
jgi:hypothetical protein